MFNLRKLPKTFIHPQKNSDVATTYDATEILELLGSISAAAIGVHFLNTCTSLNSIGTLGVLVIQSQPLVPSYVETR